MSKKAVVNSGVSEIRVTPLVLEDCGQVATIHREVFADTPSSRLGQNYCTKLYGLYATESDAFGYVLRRNGEAVGFVVGGTKKTHDNISTKLRKQAALAISVRPMTLVSFVMKAVGERLRKTLRTESPAKQKKNPTIEEKRVSKLFLIGVHEKARGTGGARQLLDSFSDHAFSLGFDKVVLNVYRTNSRARAAYEKAGWILDDRGGESVEYYTLRS